jgi:hypothetical protein
MRKVRILTIPEPGSSEQPQELGQMVDRNGQIVGTTPAAEEILGPDPEQRRVKFDRYHRGWSNGYVETKAA